ncbi:hypothetical protein R70006_00680 [Paraburkholderia domus]|uniref:hypothetical protein n=1 Tax=Paraburkholderia domus TaxID=2793075 RepID=UPI00191190FF|nr:hypothetical protein [Paraburkholderia domus]MBK5048464.1 hypothetical protein [Burkholderia sp. R-70006]CAE6700031.1 hypothetical protein R70006_00680 [Paraburkholderia domus]
MILLPPKNDNEGAEVRLLLAECRGPSFSTFTLSDATTCMQLMDLVLFNRLDNPGRFGAKGATTVGDIIRAPGQFAGFQNYPKYDSHVQHRIQVALDIANSAKDKRSPDFAAFINAAIAIATSTSTITEPSPGTLVSWRTAGSGSPGSGFALFKTVLGNDFYFVP